MHQVAVKLAQYWSNIQDFLFPRIADEVGVLTDKHRQLISILELVRVEEFIPDRKGMPFRPAKDRAEMARAFVAKAVYNFPETRDLLDRLKTDSTLRLICGWDSPRIPSESKFSRAFAEFARTGLPGRVHERLIAEHQGERLVGHISRDSTAITGREKRAPRAANAPPQPKRRRGRPKKGEVALPPPLSRLERQVEMTLEEMLADLPTQCDIGCKRNSKNSVEYWVGYKLHLDVADGQIPISAVLTSASVHDSQVALPLAAQTHKRVTNLYDLMDAAYDATIIDRYSRRLGHIPLIDHNFKGDSAGKNDRQAEQQRLKSLHFTMPETEHFKERTSAERVNARIKDEFGGRFVRVRGHAKVLAHLMFGLLALTADQLLRLLG
jgi:hypothetical protein